MALIENFDVDFEDYIIFHRGIKEAGIKDDGHFHVVYQDGTDQDIGDPYGDKLADAEQAKNAAKEAQRNAEKAKKDAEQARDAAIRSETQAASSASAAAASLTSVGTAKDAAVQAKIDAETARDITKGYRDEMATKAGLTKESSDKAVAAAEISEAWAVGQRVGQDVEPEDPTYENNSKYYANLAKTSETNAAESEATAVQASETATQAAQQTSQDLADVRDVASNIVKPLEKLEGLTYDSENDSYSIDSISNETIDSYFVEYLPLAAEIITQPSNLLLEEGVPITFSVEAIHAKAYQWQYRVSGQEIWNDITSEPLYVMYDANNEIIASITPEGYNTDTLTLAGGLNIGGTTPYTYEYRCAITGENDAEEDTIAVFLVKPIIIEEQPVSVIAENGETVDFSMRATGNIAYQWQSRHVGETEWTDLKRTTVSLLSPAGTHLSFENDVYGSDYSRVFRCLVIRRDGDEEASNEVMIFPNQNTYDTHKDNISQWELSEVKDELQGINTVILVAQMDLENFEEGSEAWMEKRAKILELQEEAARIEAIIAEMESRLAEQEEEGGGE